MEAKLYSVEGGNVRERIGAEAIPKIWDAYAKRQGEIEAIAQARISLEREVKRARGAFASRIRRVSLENAPAPSFVAVDSAFKIIDYDIASEYLLAVVGLTERKRAEVYGLQETLPETAWGFSQIDDDPDRRLMEGLALGVELIIAREVGKDKERIYLDGSLLTFFLKLNSMLTYLSSANEKAGEEREWHRKARFIGEAALRAFADLLSEGKVVACPKFSRRNEFLASLKDSLVHADWPLESFLSLSDTAFLSGLLEEGEWVEAPAAPLSLNIKAPDPEVGRALKELLKKMRVYYLKGLRGKVYKFESIAPFDPSEAYPFTGGREFFPLAIADREAKGYLAVLSSYRSVLGLTPYRES